MWEVPALSAVRLAVVVFAATEVQVPEMGAVCLYHHAAVWPLIVRVAVVRVMALAVRSSVVNALAVASMVCLVVEPGWSATEWRLSGSKSILPLCATGAAAM